MIHLSDEQIHEYLDGEASPPAQLAVEAHQTACPECAARLEVLRVLFAELDQLPAVAPERDFVPVVLSQLEQRKRSESLPRSIRWVTLGQMAAALLAGFLVWPIMTTLEILSPGAMLSMAASSLSNWLEQTRFPSLVIEIPALDIPLSTAALVLAMTGLSILWLVGNGVLLIPLSRRRS